MYTDEQIFRVAKWLGIQSTPFQLNLPPSRDDFEFYLLSPEGRCAIEDRFAQEPATKCPPMFIKGGDWGYTVFIVTAGDMCQAQGDGSTPAEAWLDVAVKYTEEK